MPPLPISLLSNTCKYVSFIYHVIACIQVIGIYCYCLSRGVHANADYTWEITGSNRTNNIDGAEPVRVSHNAILVSRMHLATMALLCKQTTDNSRTGYPPEPRWRHLSGNRILFVPHWSLTLRLHASMQLRSAFYFHLGSPFRTLIALSNPMSTKC